MTNPEHVEIVKQGAAAIAAWKKEHRGSQLNLEAADLRGAHLSGADLSGDDLDLTDLNGADLREADLGGASFFHAELRRANLEKAQFPDATLRWADLSEANLRNADLVKADFFETKLSGANVRGAALGWTSFANMDLSTVKGLESVRHTAPSSIGIDTLYRSQGTIPEEFLRGCGVPEDFITHLPSLIGTMQPIQYQSCFISYSSQDEEFARRLHEKMRGEKLRVWFAPEDMQGGQKLIEQIDRAIQVNDRLLLVLSEHSMNSEWVKTELRKAHHAELRLPKSSEVFTRQKLFPIRLVSMDRIREWSCFDADTGKDLAVELREYHIPDFSNWKNHDAFESAFADLLRDLRAQA